MKFSAELQKGVLLRRYKRFLADVLIANQLHTVHCPNTGSMLNCVVEGSDCWLSRSENPKRKYPLTWELATTTSGHLACINTLRANQVVENALDQGHLATLCGYRSEREVKYGEHSRCDFLLTREQERCYVEVKSVTLAEHGKFGLFPDAKSERARKHLKELMNVAAAGHRAVMLFCAQHNGIQEVAPARAIDPEYSKLLRLAANSGVEVLAFGCAISPTELRINQTLPVRL